MNKQTFMLLCVLSFYHQILAQQSDYFCLKDKHEKTLKTYYPGSFLIAETYDGMILTGYIKEIRNDSIRFQQRETRLVPTAFGTKVDSVIYTIQFDHHIIKRFMWGKKYEDQKPHGKSVLYVPNLMMIGGEAYIALELTNTLIQKQSIASRNSLPSLIVAAASVATGWVVKNYQKKKDKVGGRYHVVYIKAGSLVPPHKL